MNEFSRISAPELTVSRRTFLGGAAGLTFALSMTGIVSEAAAAMGKGGDNRLNAYVTVHPDDTITILAPAAEMGQGVMTTLPLIVAEFMDADWDKVSVELAPADHALYGNPKFGGLQYTVGSLTVMGYWEPLSQLGAQTRQVLVDAAAQKWGVPASECSTQPSRVVHTSGKSMTYGEIASFAHPPKSIPAIDAASLRKPKDYRLLGTDVGRVDVPSKTNGTAKYGMDIEIDGMVYASMWRAPVSKAKPLSVNEAEVLKIRGVKRVIKLPYGVAVIGDTVEATRNGRYALEVKWSRAPGDDFTSSTAMSAYVKAAGDLTRDAVTWKSVGDTGAALKGAADVKSFEYTSEHNYHAQMEPMNATARVSADGKSAEIWASTQGPTIAKMVSAKILKTSPDKVTVHPQLIGGGFGRRAQPDFVVDAVLLSKILGGGTPVKVIYSREDDVAAGRMRPMTAHRIDVGLDENGMIVGWNHRVVAESPIAYTSPARLKKSGGKDILVMAGSELPHYGIPNWHAEYVREIRGARLAAWRGIGAGYTKFAVEATIDKLAAAAGVDPVEYRLKLFNKDRARNVVKAVAEMADWKRKRDGTALGISFSELHDSMVAGVAEVSVDDDGKIKVHNFWMVADPGVALQPRNIVAQMESNIVYGLSQTLTEEMTLEDGAVQQTNFNDYRVFRMEDVPNIEVKVMAQGTSPSGVGELGLPPTAGAVANAVRALTGAELTQMPFTPARVKAAMKA